MKWRFVVAALLPLLSGCEEDRGNAKPSQPAASVAGQREDVSPDTYALGTAVTNDGAVPKDAVVESVGRGGEVFLSVNVSGASTGQTVQVAWLDPAGHILRSVARHADRGTRYVAFSSGPTRGWRSGVHRARVVIDGRTVSEKAFGVM